MKKIYKEPMKLLRKAVEKAGAKKVNQAVLKNRENPRKALVGLLAALLAVIIGCANMPALPSACDSQTESMLCDLSKKYNVRLEDIGNGLIIANAIAISQNLYTKEEAVSVMKDIRAILDNPISYAFFKTEVYKHVDAYPGLLEVASIYFAELGAVSKMMYAADRKILIGWLNQQIKILGG
uniref:Uncharacterized protein n=1 Tax=viral metagenome TaxID=1070528 RepID=A0A6H2A4Q1_9ZZZZ